MQGPVINWVADHRRHHAFSDKEGDPHSPWLFGTSPARWRKGFWHAHIGWLFDRDKTNEKRFTPDLLADRDVVRVNRLFMPAVGDHASCVPAAPRRSVDLVVVGRAHRVLLGRASCGWRCCTTSPGR